MGPSIFIILLFLFFGNEYVVHTQYELVFRTRTGILVQLYMDLHTDVSTFVC